ncbi:MAG: hypothetical protein ABJH63_11790 [Rhizobiaceae bacterium]
MAKKHVIIESLSAAEHFRHKFEESELVWWTTSPAVIRTLEKDKEDVRSIEAVLKSGQFDAVCFVAMDLTEQCCDYIAQSHDWPSWVDASLLFKSHIYKCVLISLYKSLLVECVRTVAGNDDVYCVGDPTPSAVKGGLLVFDRVETLFAQLATHSSLSDVQIEQYEVQAAVKSQVELGVYRQPSRRLERLLGLLMLDASSLLYKVWRRLSRFKLGKNSRARIWPIPKKTIHILKDCEMIEENFLQMLWRGAGFASTAEIPRIPDAELSRTLSERKDWLDGLDLTKNVHKSCRKHKLAWADGLHAGLAHALERISIAVCTVHSSLGEWEKQASKTMPRYKLGDEILSSTINSIEQRLFAFLCKSRGIVVNTVDHGVTHALSEWGIQHAPYTGMGVADRGFYHCERASKLMKQLFSDHVTFAVGLPKSTIQPKLRLLKRHLARRLLGVKPDDQVVMIVCDLPRNNFMYGPYLDTDFQYLTKTIEMINLYSNSFPNSKILLKLYPTQRYIDNYDFSEFEMNMPNFQVVRDFEFRNIRHAADLLVTTSMQSTLGWVSGAGVPFHLVEFEWSKGEFSALRTELKFEELKGDLLILDKGQVCLGKAQNFSKILMS